MARRDVLLVGQPPPNVGASVSAVVVAGLAGVPAASLATGRTLTPAAVAALVGVPSPAVNSTAAAPTSKPVVGTDVGVPSGTSLTASSGLGTFDTAVSRTLTNPETGATRTFTPTRRYYRRRWTSTIVPRPGVGECYWFQQCEIDVTGDFFCVDGDSANGSGTLLQPLFVFEDCTLKGNDSVRTGFVGGDAWFERTAITNCEDGISGLYHTAFIDGLSAMTTDGGPDSHSDGMQCSGIGNLLIWGSWLDAGQPSETANAPLRIGTENSAVDDCGVFYTTFQGSQHGLQIRGDAGAGDVTGVRVQGCRWAQVPFYGPTNPAELTVDLWTDNRYLDGVNGGASVPNPAP